MNAVLARAFEDWTEGRRSLGLWCFGVVAWPCAHLYRLAEWLGRRLRGGVVLPGLRHARLIVVSSPLVGGVGKTPLVAYLASQLSARGGRVALVTLGYGRRLHGTQILSSATRPPSVAQTGDEAAELRESTGACVAVGDEPAEVIAELDQNRQFEWIVFDDGIRRRWAREQRVVVVSRRDLERPVRFLPLGRWRTTPHFIAVADVVVITGMDYDSQVEREHHRDLLASWGFAGPVAWFRSVPERLVSLGLDHASRPPAPPDNRPYVFCALGMPSRFLAQVQEMGLEPGGFWRFEDHHPYTRHDIARLEKRARHAGCRWLLTSQKDQVKIDPAWLGSTPALFLRIMLQSVAGDDLAAILRKPWQAE